MSNLAQILKEEIRRIARSETKAQTAKLKRDVVKAKKNNVALRRTVAQLTRDNELLMASEKRRKLPAGVAPEDVESARITAKGIRSLRRKLGLSQAEFGKLVGVSMVSVGNWEKKGKGALKLRGNTGAAILALRGVGAREAKRRVEMAEEKPAPKSKKVTRKVKARKVRKVRKSGKPRMRPQR